MITLHRHKTDPKADKIEEGQGGRGRRDPVRHRPRPPKRRPPRRPGPFIVDGGEKIEGDEKITSWMRELQGDLEWERSLTGDACYLDPETGEVC